MYLRGLALGIIVTAVVLSIGNTKKNTELTDSEIKAKAKALGMIDPEDKTLADDFDSSDASVTNEAEPEVSEAEASMPEVEEIKAEEPEIDEPKVEEIKPEESEPEEPVSEEAKVEEVKTSSCTITVNKGYGSDTVAKLLEKGGAVASAKDFDKYLCDNHLDNKISVGKYEIPAGADYATIAQIITNRK